MTRFGLCSLIVCAFFSVAQPVVAGRPLVIDDAATVSLGSSRLNLDCATFGLRVAAANKTGPS